ncbi:hypothetical protein PINS_up014695 [Pythium insidiosum]|nr:hypothetical protein PINS_up014695 [Pythium insidiosum]
MSATRLLASRGVRSLAAPRRMQQALVHGCISFAARVQQPRSLESRRFLSQPVGSAVVSDDNTEEAKASVAPATALVRSLQSDFLAIQNLVHLALHDDAFTRRFEVFVRHIETCFHQNGMVFVTGIGKSGIVARRFASTLSSLSIRSQAIHASEWAHGELGNARAGDVVILLSHSGETAELLPLPAHFAQSGCTTLAIVSRSHSTLASNCTASIVAPAMDSPDCPVPSRSIIVQEAMTNAVVEYLANSLPDRPIAFLENHPGGAIGQRASNRESHDPR